MTLSREEKVAALSPLVERLCVSHVWLNHRHVEKPLTKVMLSEHVQGGAKLGLCPIVPGESTCRVALLDLDSHKGDVPWATMLQVAGTVSFFLEQDGFQPVMWRSSGGKGIHIFTLWDEPQDAYSVREAMRAAIAGGGYEEGTGGVSKFEIEIFPKQDAVPADGFGSMFVLPFCGQSELL